ncbi:two-component regulator propeller domain-containing protein [Reichenbachiella sp. MALMAid0571]|uniref:ligand-binding sensor domain-containing protein n=1 Tax=Reichenbachiella sp. MALMAid0571 TaxID=3143939 RepID=UPI0032DE5EBB
MKKSLLILSSILLFACNNNIETTKNDIANKASEFYVDVPFVQEYHEGFIIDANEEKANDIRAIHADQDDNIWIATKNGVYVKKSNSLEWDLIVTGIDQGPAYDVKSDRKGTAWMATWNGVYSYNSGQLEKMIGPKPPLAKVVVAEEGVYALGPYGIWLFQNNVWNKKDYKAGRSIRAAISDGNQGLWIGTDVGLFHCNDQKTTPYQKNEDALSAYIKGLDYSDVGNLWVAGLGGITIRNKTQKIGEKLPKDGITHAEVRTVKRAPDGRMWVGTDYGITRFTPGKKEYSVRLSRRWLMSDEVRDIAFDSNGNAWIATAEGVSAIKRRNMTLEQKADYFYDKLIKRHVRKPWIIARSRLTVPGDTSSIVSDDDDNDGEFTSNYLAMESFRYAATKDPKARERAKKAFDFLHYLREVTEMDGFFARTIIPVSWERSHDMNRTYTPHELADEIIENPRQKPVEVRWHVTKDGKWKWKGDTSSDEFCGHFFGYYWYYTLVADDEEKKRIANHVSKIVDHLMRNDFNAVDVDGTHTKWGVWSPEILNNDPEWSPERALNSLEMLSFLKFTYKVTGDEKYQKAYLKLINEEGYIKNAKMLHNTNPAWNTYFDIYLTLYLYPTLISFEDDPEIKKEYQEHMEGWFQKYKETKSPLINFTYNYLTGGKDELDNSIFFLKDAPLDLVNWRIDNGKREDLQIVRRPILEVLAVDELRPPSEYRVIRWDRYPYHAVDGDPSEEYEPVYWLLPYWMGRYQQLIVAEK